MNEQESSELLNEIADLNLTSLNIKKNEIKKLNELSSLTIEETNRLKEEELEDLIKKIKQMIKELQMLNSYDKELLMIKQNLVPLHGPRQTCSFHINKNLIKEMEQYLGFYKTNSNFSKSDFVNMALFEFIEKYKVF